MIQTAFPNLQLDKERLLVFREFFSDLTPQEFEKGIKEFCRQQTEIYPGTNLIACIRKYALDGKECDVWWQVDENGKEIFDNRGALIPKPGRKRPENKGIT